MYKFNELPLDLLESLCQYLTIPDIQALSQTSSVLRSIFSEKAWSRCRLTDPTHEDCSDSAYAVVNKDILLHPDNYSWFRNDRMCWLLVMNLEDLVFDELLIEKYPRLKRISLGISEFDLDFKKEGLCDTIIEFKRLPNSKRFRILLPWDSTRDDYLLLNFLSEWKSWYDFKNNVVCDPGSIMRVRIFRVSEGILDILSFFTSLKELTVFFYVKGYVGSRYLPLFAQSLQYVPPTLKHISLGLISKNTPEEDLMTFNETDPPLLFFHVQEVSVFCDDCTFLNFLKFPDLTDLNYGPQKLNFNLVQVMKSDFNLENIQMVETFLEFCRVADAWTFMNNLVMCPNLKKLAVIVKPTLCEDFNHYTTGVECFQHPEKGYLQCTYDEFLEYSEELEHYKLGFDEDVQRKLLCRLAAKLCKDPIETFRDFSEDTPLILSSDIISLAAVDFTLAMLPKYKALTHFQTKSIGIYKSFYATSHFYTVMDRFPGLQQVLLIRIVEMKRLFAFDSLPKPVGNTGLDLYSDMVWIMNHEMKLNKLPPTRVSITNTYSNYKCDVLIDRNFRTPFAQPTNPSWMREWRVLTGISESEIHDADFNGWS